MESRSYRCSMKDEVGHCHWRRRWEARKERQEESRRRRRARRRGMKGAISAPLPRLDRRYFPGGRPATWRFSPFSAAAKATVTLDFLYSGHTNTHTHTRSSACASEELQEMYLENVPRKILQKYELVVQFVCNKASYSLQGQF